MVSDFLLAIREVDEVIHLQEQMVVAGLSQVVKRLADQAAIRLTVGHRLPIISIRHSPK